MKHNKNADTLLFLLLFTKSHGEKNIEKTFFVSAGVKNGGEQQVLGILYRNTHQIQKLNSL